MNLIWTEIQQFRQEPISSRQRQIGLPICEVQSVLSDGQWNLWSVCAVAQSHLHLRLVHILKESCFPDYMSLSVNCVYFFDIFGLRIELLQWRNNRKTYALSGHADSFDNWCFRDFVLYWHRLPTWPVARSVINRIWPLHCLRLADFILNNGKNISIWPQF